MINKIKTVLTATVVLTLQTFTRVLKVFFDTESAHLQQLHPGPQEVTVSIPRGDTA